MINMVKNIFMKLKKKYKFKITRKKHKYCPNNLQVSNIKKQ